MGRKKDWAEGEIELIQTNQSLTNPAGAIKGPLPFTTFLPWMKFWGLSTLALFSSRCGLLEKGVITGEVAPYNHGATDYILEGLEVGLS